MSEIEKCLRLLPGEHKETTIAIDAQVKTIMSFLFIRMIKYALDREGEWWEGGGEAMRGRHFEINIYTYHVF